MRIQGLLACWCLMLNVVCLLYTLPNAHTILSKMHESKWFASGISTCIFFNVSWRKHPSCKDFFLKTYIHVALDGSLVYSIFPSLLSLPPPSFDFVFNSILWGIYIIISQVWEKAVFFQGPDEEIFHSEASHWNASAFPRDERDQLVQLFLWGPWMAKDGS